MTTFASKVGQRCRVHSGVVLGSDGFGLAKHEGAWLKVPQLGGVVIGDDLNHATAVQSHRDDENVRHFCAIHD